MTAQLYRADAVELLRSLEDGSVACILTDPPYCSGGFTETARRGADGSAYTRNVREGPWLAADNMSTGALAELLRLVGTEAIRVLKAGGWLCVFADWRMGPVLVPAIGSAGLQFRAKLIWDKQFPGLGVGFRGQYEEVLCFTTGKPLVYSGSYGNVLGCKRTKNENHPTEKPLDLLRRVLEVTTEPGDLVVDPFMGSGSTGVAAVGMGRRFIGSDIDPAHLETAVLRIGEAGSVEAPQTDMKPQPRLFAGLGAK